MRTLRGFQRACAALLVAITLASIGVPAGAVTAPLIGLKPATALARPCEGNGQYFTTECPTGIKVAEAPIWNEGYSLQIPQYWTGTFDWGWTINVTSETCPAGTNRWEWGISPVVSGPNSYSVTDTPHVSSTSSSGSFKLVPSPPNDYGYRYIRIVGACFNGTTHTADLTQTLILFRGYQVGPPPEGGNPPTATCTATQSGAPGSYHFVADADDPEGGPLIYEWDFGDGSAKEPGDNRTHQYTLPGTFNASLKVTDVGGQSVVAPCPVEVAAPELQLSVTLVDHDSRSLAPDEVVTARIHVQADGNGVGALSGIQLESPGLLLDPDDGTVEITDAADVSDTFDLEPGEGRDFDFEVKATGAGRVELTAHATATDAAGGAVDETSGPLTLNVSLLSVELSISPDEIDLVEGDDGPEPVTVRLAVKITNNSDEPVENVTVLPDLDILAREGTQPARMPLVEDSGPDPDADIGTLEPGATATRYFDLTAQDDGKVRILAIVESADPSGGDTPARTSGQLDVDVDPDTLLYLETELIGAGGARERNVEAGAPQLITGFIENRSNDHKISLDALMPILTGDIANGNPVPLWRMLSSGPQNGCTLPLQGELEPGEMIEFQALVQTFIGEGTRATVDYQPSGALIGSDGEETELTADQIRIKGGSLPYTLHIDDGVATAPAASDDLRDKIAWFSFGAVEAVPQWLGSFFVGLRDFPRTLGELLGKGIASLPQAAEYLAAYLYGVYQEENGPHELAVRITNDIVEATGKSYDEVYEGVNSALDEWTVPYYEAYETGDYETSYRMLGNVGGNVALEILSCYAKLPEAARFIELAAHVKSTGIGKRLSDGLRALKAGDIIPFDDMRRLYGIGIEQGAALKALAEEKGLLVTARFRQPKSLEWIREKLAVLKPERIKLKNVDEIDVGFLGYNQAHEASVIVKRPLDLADERIAELYQLKSSDKAAFDAALDAELSRASGNYSGATSELKQAARERLATRIKEWVSPDAGYVRDMRALAERGRVELPWNYKDNFLPGTDGLPGTFTERDFRLLGEDPDYQIIQMADKAGDFRPVTGDIDIVGIQKANGLGLTPAERVEIYRILQETTGMQHPESATWIGPNGEVIFDYKGELLADHGPGGEPLVQFAPDGKARAVFISPEMSYFNTATGDAHMWYVGGYRQPKPVVFNYGGTSLGVYFPDRPAPGFVPYIVPGQWVIDGVGAGNPGDGTVGTCRVSFGTGDGAQVVGPDGSGGLRSYDNDLRTWQEYDTSRCGPGPDRANITSDAETPTILLLPQSGLAAPAAAGDIRIEIADLAASFPALFTGPDSYFEVGQEIVLNPGATNEERRTIGGFGSLILDAPLAFDHEVGEMVSIVSAADPDPDPDPDPDRVDAVITVKRTGHQVGDGIYNADGADQSVSATRRIRHTAAFIVTVQNEGSTAGSFTVSGLGTEGDYKVHYYSLGRRVTGRVVNGTYRTRLLAPGGIQRIKVRVRVQRGASIGSSIDRVVTVRSVANSAVVDAVKLSVFRLL